jgi:hypothetical protein
MSPRPAFAPDAAMALGIAATALPFARTPEAEAERWLRVLRLHGKVGAALQALGVSEVPLPAPGEGAASGLAAPVGPDHPDAIALVTEQAVHIADERDAVGVGTTDVFMAVLRVYGSDFDRVLRAHGTDCGEVIERLGGNPAAQASG